MEGTHDTAITLSQIKVESISKPKKSEIKLHDLAKTFKLFYSKEATNKIAQKELAINVKRYVKHYICNILA